MIMETLKHTADRILNGDNPQVAIKEHIDLWNKMPAPGLFTEEPAMTGIDYIDAWLAAAAEYEAFLIGADCPSWADQPQRFLKEPFMFGGRNARMFALIETPFAFRRRLLFTGRTSIKFKTEINAS